MQYKCIFGKTQSETILEKTQSCNEQDENP